MSDVTEILSSAQGGQLIENLARSLGLSTEQTRTAVEALTPALALGLRNAATNPAVLEHVVAGVVHPTHLAAYDDPAVAHGEEARELGQATIAQLFGSGSAAGQVAQIAARDAGLRPDILARMLPILASVVLGGLSKSFNNQGLGSILEQIASGGGLGSILGQLGGATTAPPAPSGQARQSGGGSRRTARRAARRAARRRGSGGAWRSGSNKLAWRSRSRDIAGGARANQEILKSWRRDRRESGPKRRAAGRARQGVPEGLSSAANVAGGRPVPTFHFRFDEIEGRDRRYRNQRSDPCVFQDGRAALVPAKVQPHPSHDAPFIRRTVVAAGNAKIVNWIDTTCLRQLQVNICVLNCWSRSLLCFSQATGLFAAAAAV